MLNKLSGNVAYCLQRAEEARRHAERETDPVRKEDFRQAEAGWLALAQSYQVSARVDAFCRSRDVDKINWRNGQRVERVDSNEQGTVMQEGANVKVRWDGGATSYFKSGKAGNVKLAPEGDS